MNNLFPPELRTASVVQRWSIVRTLTEDSVSNHSFYVAFYALQIARLINWPGPYQDLMFAALLHDVEEVIISDIISPVKKAIVDQGAMSNFLSEQMKLRLPLIETQLDAIYQSIWADSIENIVKVADKVDAVIFLVIEQRMGNAVIAPLYDDAQQHLRAAWEALGLTLYATKYEIAAHGHLWDDQLWPAIQSHWRHGAIGII